MRKFTFGAVLLTAGVATSAEAAPWRIDRVEKPPTLDGVPKEWERELTSLSVSRGATGGGDCVAKGAISYDDKNIYVAVDVTDDKFVGGEGDRVELGFTLGGKAQTVTLFAGNPGKSAGKAVKSGASVSGAVVVEAPRKGGYSLEAKLPWSAFQGAHGRVALRGYLAVHDVDASSIEGTAGTSAADSSQWVRILTTPEQALEDGLVKDKKLTSITHQGSYNVAGDGALEQVLVYDHRYLVALGSGFRGGKEYFWRDLSMPQSTLTIPLLEARDFDGDGRHELILTERVTSGPQRSSRDVLQILKFDGSDAAQVIFQHEIGISTQKGSIRNSVTFGGDGARATLVLKPGVAQSWTEKTFGEPIETTFHPALLPWGPVESQTYEWKGSTITKTQESRRAVSPESPTPTTASAPAKSATPAAIKSDPQAGYRTFKKDRNVTSRARYETSADLAEGAEAEVAIVHGKELVVFGSNYKSGGYAFVSLPFAKEEDVLSVRTIDATGDKKAELVVRGVIHQKGPNQEDVERVVEVVYQSRSEGLRRVFAAEVRRSIGAKTLVGSLALGQSRATLAPAKADGFTEENYPFSPNEPRGGSIEPIVPPWGARAAVRFKWNGSAFVSE